MKSKDITKDKDDKAEIETKSNTLINSRLLEKNIPII